MKETTTTGAVARFPRASRRNMIIAIGFALAIAIVGYLLIMLRAVGPFASVEPESSTANSIVVVGNDTTASGGKYVQFGSGITNPPPPPTTTGFTTDYYNKWPKGPRYSPTTEFPIGVWLQEPLQQASAYKALGVNTFVGLWQWQEAGSNRYPAWEQDQLNTLKTNGMQAFAAESGSAVTKSLGMTNSDRLTGWLNGDEPDMQETINFTSWQSNADAMRKAGSDRPVFGNFGKGFTNGGWFYDRISDADRKKLCDALDIPSVDFYPTTDPWEPPERTGVFMYGVVQDTLHRACPGKVTWAFVETTQPFNDQAATPDTIQQGVWLSVLHGANGIDYFIHNIGADSGAPRKGDLLNGSEWVANKNAMSTVNKQLHALAGVLNTSDFAPRASIKGANNIPIATMIKNYGGSYYLFTMADGNAEKHESGATSGAFTVPVSTGTATVVNENRTVPISGGKIVDTFNPYQLHIYKFNN